MQVQAEVETANVFRGLVRDHGFEGQTAGRAPNHLQGNVVILPKKYASDFLLFCMNNPKPCPLIGLSEPGNPKLASLGHDVDIRTDVPKYRIFRDGELESEVADISHLWRDDLVTFVIGCSFTFEDALLRNGFDVRHISMSQNVPMFRTNIPTIPGGKFEGPVVVSMRPFKEAEISKVYELAANYPQAHGTPIYWGEPEKIGINDLQKPDYGEPVEVREDEIPVFWACGVTPQAAINAANPDLCITHAPGHMLVTDVRSNERVEVIAGMQHVIQPNPTHKN